MDRAAAADRFGGRRSAGADAAEEILDPMLHLADALLQHLDGADHGAGNAPDEAEHAKHLFAALGPVMQSEDAREGMMSFVERRAARFTGK